MDATDIERRAELMVATQKQEDRVRGEVPFRAACILVQGEAGVITGTGGIAGLCWLDIVDRSLAEER